MDTVITIGGTDYDAAARASARFVGIDQLVLSVDEYSALDFTILGCSATPPFVPNTVVLLSADQGAGPVVVFRGAIVHGPQASSSPDGWRFTYHCLDVKQQADYVPVQSARGSACCQFNLPTDDPEYISTDAGLTVGQIVTRVLTVVKTATNLTVQGVAGLTVAGSTATITAGPTISDLAALTIVPRIGVRVEGPAVLQALEGFIHDWYPEISVWVRPDGVIRMADPKTFTARSLVVPADTTAGDPVDWPDITFDLSNCYTQYQIVGRDITSALLSLRDGTLSKGLRDPLYPSWTLDDHIQPRGSVDSGTCTITTSTTASVVSDSTPAPTWGADYWPSVGGVVWFFDLSASGVGIQTSRLVTTCTAYSGGATIGWDTDQPLDTDTYTTYQLTGRNTATAYVGRLFDVAEPATPATGLDTFIGANLEVKDPNGIWPGNMSQDTTSQYAVAKVLWSLTGEYPFYEIPVPCRVLPETGQVLLAEPDCLAAAQQAGSVPGLFLGYPTTSLGGLPYDVQVAVPYNRGPLTAVSPAPGAFSGSAFTLFGLERPMIWMNDAWTYRGDQAAMNALAAQRLASMCNAVIEGSIGHHGIPGGWDVFSLGYGLNIAFGSGSGPLDGELLPVRSVAIRWPNDGADLHTVAFRFSNKQAPYASNSNFLHPGFTHEPEDRQGFYVQPLTFVVPDAGPMARSGRGGRAMSPDQAPNFHPGGRRLPERENQHIPMRGPQHKDIPDHARPIPGIAINPDAPGPARTPAPPRPGGLADTRGRRPDDDTGTGGG